MLIIMDKIYKYSYQEIVGRAADDVTPLFRKVQEAKQKINENLQRTGAKHTYIDLNLQKSYQWKK